MLLMVAETVAIVVGRGTPGALAVPGASCEPKTVRIAPGADAAPNEAPFATLVIDGGPVSVDVTVSASESGFRFRKSASVGAAARTRTIQPCANPMCAWA